MKVNYHSHTTRCHHAVGTEREYVEAAIESGLEVLGFSDHTPYPFKDGYVSRIRMGMDELEDYVNTVLALKDEYRNDIEIHLGLEVEYYPAVFSDLVKAVSEYPIEYFLLAQHYLGNEQGDVYSGTATEDPATLIRYCRHLKDAMDTGCFTYLAHPDLIRFIGDPVLYDTHMRQLCRDANAYKLPLEINFLGLCENRHYPNETFWKIAGEENCDVIFGIDAHKPTAFKYVETLQKAHALVEKYGLHLLEDVTLRRPSL